MFAVATGGAFEPRTHPGEATSTAAPELRRTVAPGRTLEVSASDLWGRYSRDPAGADRLYRDRSVLLTGDVRAVERNYQGDVVVRLSAGDAFDTVNATLASGDDPLRSTLAKGRPVSLLCVGRGTLMGAPLLGSCSVR